MNKEEIKHYMAQVGQRAVVASRIVGRADTAAKNAALLKIADLIEQDSQQLIAENQKDLENARQNQLEASLLDRLDLNEARIAAMAEGLRQVAGLSDPVGTISNLAYRPSGIQVGKMRVPLGVIGIIYESRPNVTADAAALCIKSGNAAILRGGSEAIHSNRAIAAYIHRGLQEAGLSADIVQVIETTDREAVGELIRLKGMVDVIVPRGGKGLIERISNEATVPVIKHLDGICHVYIDAAANLSMATDIAMNSKTQRYGTCNTMETLLVDEAVAALFLPGLADRMKTAGVELRGCEKTCSLVRDVIPAEPLDWDTEYLAAILSIRVVQGLDQAIEHIHQHSSGHTESIVTQDYSRARRFMREVDSSSVMVNASTRFADGFEYGLGAEIGISTDKLHARGPVGLEGLTTEKYVVFGDGQIRK